MNINSCAISAVDMPFVVMPFIGRLDAVVDPVTGLNLPTSWTGLCVSAVSTKLFWLVELVGDKQVASKIGRFEHTADAFKHARSLGKVMS